MNIIIPLGGLGSRFTNEGYTQPKPLINVLGKPMIFHLIDNLKLQENDNIYIFYKHDLDKYNFSSIINQKYGNITLVPLKTQTRGAAETLLIGLEKINHSKKTVCLDCDTFYTYDILNKFRNQNDNSIFTFFDNGDSPIYSYVNITNKNQVTDIKEKVKISSYANTGCYCFESGSELLTYCRRIVNNNIRFNNEFYTSCVIKEMLNDNHKFEMNLIDKDDFHCLGTPLQVKVFCDDYGTGLQKITQKRICFDLDNTLVTYPKIKNDYSSCEPILKNIKMVQYLKKIGWTIIIYTARRMRTHNGNVGKIIQDVGEITINSLKKFNIPYDELHFGKPYAHFYVDDLAINAYSDLEKELGFYIKDIDERYFNLISKRTVNTIEKSSIDEKKLAGEIHWYNNIPKSIIYLFPKMFRYSSNSYEIERIKGVTLSHMYVNEILTIEILQKFLKSIEEIHNSVNLSTVNKDDQENQEKINIYANYKDKLKERYDSNINIYKKLKNSDEIFGNLYSDLVNYETEENGQLSVIHGDPVFTNCLYNENGFKFIDMRGIVNGHVTIFGDKFYDYAKIYQSLIGYDEILLDKIIDQQYKSNLIEYFENYITEKFNNLNDIKLITKSLLFSLIPLHTDHEKNKKYFELLVNI